MLLAALALLAPPSSRRRAPPRRAAAAGGAARGGARPTIGRDVLRGGRAARAARARELLARGTARLIDAAIDGAGEAWRLELEDDDWRAASARDAAWKAGRAWRAGADARAGAARRVLGRARALAGALLDVARGSTRPGGGRGGRRRARRRRLAIHGGRGGLGEMVRWPAERGAALDAVLAYHPPIDGPFAARALAARARQRCAARQAARPRRRRRRRRDGAARGAPPPRRAARLLRMCGAAKERRFAHVAAFLAERGVRGYSEAALAELEAAYDWDYVRHNDQRWAPRV